MRNEILAVVWFLLDFKKNRNLYCSFKLKMSKYFKTFVVFEKIVETKTIVRF